MRRRSLLALTASAVCLPLAGCVTRSGAVIDRTVRDWQTFEQKSFPLDLAKDDIVRIEFQEIHSHGGGVEIFRPDPWEGIRVFESGFRGNRNPTDTIIYRVAEGGRHTLVVRPCCSPGAYTAYAWIKVYVD